MPRCNPDVAALLVRLLTRRASLTGLLAGLEDWLYSEEADDADLSKLKAKRQEVTPFGHSLPVLALIASFFLRGWAART